MPSKIQSYHHTRNTSYLNNIRHIANTEEDPVLSNSMDLSNKDIHSPKIKIIKDSNYNNNHPNL